MSTNRLTGAILAVCIVALAVPSVAGAGGRGAGRAGEGAPRRRLQPLRPPAVSCSACLVVDDLGRVLWSRHAHQQLPNASTTKMATALVVVRAADLDDTVTVSAAAASTGGGGLDLHEGETYSVEGLLYALLLTSSNDAAVALAEHVAGSVDAFAAEMNALARRLGATDTHFLTPHGLDLAGHYSSASDLALIARRLLRDDLLAEIVATPERSIAGPMGSIPLDNRNPLLEAYRGAIGVKTGYTLLAGNVLVAAARRRGRTLISVAMHSVDAGEDSRSLLDYGFARLERTVLLRSGRVIASLVFDPAGAVPVRAGRALRGSARPSTLTMSLRVSPGLRLPLAPGERVGVATAYSSGRPVGSVPAVVGGRVEARPSPWVVEAAGALLRIADDALSGG